MYKSCFNITLLLFTFEAIGQVKMEAERQRETKSPDLVKGNNLQVEIGFRKEKLEDQQYLYQQPVATFRYGLFNALELRMELVSQTIRNKISKESQTGLVPVKFGVKAKILPQNNWLPSIGALAQVGVPSLASVDYYTDGLPFEFRMLFGNTITERLKFHYNAGVFWQMKENKHWAYSFSPIFKLSDHFNLFVEEYAFLKRGISAEHYFNGGINYYLNNSFMFDLTAGVGLSDNSSPYFLSAGFSFRLPFTGEKKEPLSIN